MSSSRSSEFGFAMESWEKGTLGDETRGWEAMHDDPRAGVARVWRPRPSAAEAIAKCCEWTGWAFIPAMQVRDLSTGLVVWRRGIRSYPDIWPEVEHEDEPPPPWELEPPPKSAPAGGWGPKAPDPAQLSLLDV